MIMINGIILVIIDR